MPDGTALGKYYIQIIPSTKGISGSISKALSGEATSAGKSAGVNIASAIKGAIAAAGIGAALKEALLAGGDLQQSFGGLETIYGDAADAAKDYAKQAVKAGISANNYAEQAVSFGAALKQAFGGDTVKAAEAANTAIMDMADNSAKMGTDMTSIQNAYQGFAKQNYTMLDNLKLGYGGTKTEMERLLADAQKLSGVEYNIDNLGDVYSAIHVIQEELGLTGVAAEEAQTTFTGSFNAMKAAATNALASLTLGQDIQPALADLELTIGTFIAGNLIPMLGNMFDSLPQVLSAALNMAINGLNFAAENADVIVQKGFELVTGLGNAIIQAAPALASAAWNLILALGDALINGDWVTTATSTVATIAQNLINAAPGLLTSGAEMVRNIANGIVENGSALLGPAVDGLGDILVNFVGVSQQTADSIKNAITGAWSIVSTLLKAAGDAIVALVSQAQTEGTMLNTIITGVADVVLATADLVSAAVDIAVSMIKEDVDKCVLAFQWLVQETQTDGTILHTVWEGIKSTVSNVLQAISGLLRTVAAVMRGDWETAFNEMGNVTAATTGDMQSKIASAAQASASAVQASGSQMSGSAQSTASQVAAAFESRDWWSVGSAMASGIAGAFEAGASWVISTAQSVASQALAAAKSVLGIASPSKEFAWIGEMSVAGMAEGILDNEDMVTSAMGQLSNAALTSGSANMDLVQTVNGYAPPAESQGNMAAEIINGIGALLQSMFPDSGEDAPVGLYFDEDKVGYALLGPMRRASKANPEVSTV